MRYEITVNHASLGKIRRITGQDKWLVEEKARLQKIAWDDEWKKRTEKENRALLKDQKIALASERATEAQKELDAFRGILVQRKITRDLWRELKTEVPFPEKQPDPPLSPEIPYPPNPADARYQVNLNFLDNIFSSRRRRKQEISAARFKVDNEEWTRETARIDENFKRTIWANYLTRMKEWELKKAAYIDRQRTINEALDNLKIQYESKNPEAIEKYCGLALSVSEYPVSFPDENVFSFLKEGGVLVVDHRLPAIADLPTLKQVKFVTSTQKFEEVHLKQNEINNLYESVLYQIWGTIRLT